MNAKMLLEKIFAKVGKMSSIFQERNVNGLGPRGVRGALAQAWCAQT